MATRMIRRYDPFAEAISLRNMMDRLMESAFVNPAQWLSGSAGFDAPAIDVIENADGYVIKAALPGWKPENVEITFENGVLTLCGEVKEEEERKDDTARYHVREIRHSSFARQVSLPTEVEADKAKAEFENGVLTLTLPKAEVVKPKQIKISTK
ncbi:MAG: Hsp20/alpha crystallin family protein [Anaerolineae bacterium]|nr:Hsp20/alpha crystallin family protein [Thermoflexales bacterium]MDW8408868.1 Hsp20/alpha crystallin family protein [Anaerolineae bacterium]